jgi:hypothetical protein
MARPGLDKNIKFRRLVRVLGEPRPHVRGYLECLWDVSYENGNPVIGDAEAIAIACDYPGEVQKIVDALLNCGGPGKSGFIEPVPGQEGQFQVHDLFDHAPRYVKLRSERERERVGQSVSARRAHKRAQKRTARVTPAPAPAPAPAPKEEPPGGAAEPPPTRAKASYQPAVVIFMDGWKAKYGERYSFRDRDGASVKWMLGEIGYDLRRWEEIIVGYLESGDEFAAKKRHDIGTLYSQFNTWKVPAKAQPPPGRRAGGAVDRLAGHREVFGAATDDRTETAAGGIRPDNGLPPGSLAGP